MIVSFNVNGEKKTVHIAPNEVLLDTLRKMGYYSVKRGCEEGECGACTVLLNGKPVKSCMLFTAQVKDKEITTLEGVGTPDNPHILQKVFIEKGAIQCGFCIPGIIITAKALLDEKLDITDEDIKEALDGNLCRCTGYVKQVEAIKEAAKILKKSRKSKKGGK